MCRAAGERNLAMVGLEMKPQKGDAVRLLMVMERTFNMHAVNLACCMASSFSRMRGV